MIEYIKMSFRNIIRRRRRTALTVVGIFIGITAVVSLVSLGQGLETSIQEEFESIGGDKLFINPGGGGLTSSGTASATLREQDLITVSSTRGIAEAGGSVFMNTGVTYNDESGFLPVIGMPTDNKELVMESWAMEVGEGRMIRSTDTSNVVLGSQVANGVFSENPGIRSNIYINGKKHRVVGILEPTGDPSIDTTIIMPIDHTRELLDRSKGFDWIFAQVADGFEPSEVKGVVEQNLRNRRNIPEGEEDFTVSTSEDLVNSFNSILSVVRGVVVGIASISLFVGAVGIMNTMYTSVTQRTREIGVMKAIGAQKKQIMFVFLLESAVIGFLGGLTGLIFGISLSWLGAYGITQFAQLPITPYLGLDLLAGSMIFSIALGIISGVLPARRAANLEPAEALRYE